MQKSEEAFVQVPTRLQDRNSAPAVFPAMMALQQVVNASSLERTLLGLVTLRVSQINRCAYCTDMHFREALANGEKIERLSLLSSWHDVSLYNARERAALLWAETLTRVSEVHLSDEIFDAVRAVFNEAQLLELTLAIVAINGWTRFNVGFRVPPDVAQ